MASFQDKMSSNHQNLFPRVVSASSSADYKRGEDLVSNSPFLKKLDQVRDRTMLSIERLYDITLSVKYLNDSGIEGAFVEVGVWRGGAVAMMALSDETQSREIWGFDTFSGHNPPPDDEFDIRGHSMRDRYFQEVGSSGSWAKADYEETVDFLRLLERGESKFQIRKGDIKNSIQENLNSIGKISFLRIDVDWYRESLISLELLFPNLQVGGIVTLDDYGHHSGQRAAVDEFFQHHNIKFTHIDYSCITAVRP
jgi:O-methyltransferase